MVATPQVLPVQPVNVMQALYGNLNQIEALKKSQQQRALLAAQTNALNHRSALNALNALGGMLSGADGNSARTSRSAGTTQIDPFTGEAISYGTTPMVTSDQTAIAAVDRVMPQLNNLIDKLPQFQSGWKNLKTHAEGLSNRWLGTQYPAPSERAEGLAQLASVPESLLKAYGLRPSEYALKVMRETVAPHTGESPEGYRQRILGKLAELQEYKAQSTNRLRDGIPLNAAMQGVNAPIAATQADPIAQEIERRKRAGIWK